MPTLTNITINEIINHIRGREYMSGVERDRLRIKQTGEVFTPTSRVQKEFDKLERYQVDIFTNPKYTFLDDHAGDGQFLGEVLIRKVQGGIDFETALSTIYGVEYELDNILLCRDRLLCKQEHLRPILERNVVQADSGRYHYRFDGSFPYDDELKQRKQQELFDTLFEQNS